MLQVVVVDVRFFYLADLLRLVINRHLSQVLTLHYLAGAALSAPNDRILLLLLVHVRLHLLVLLVEESRRLAMLLILLLLTFVQEVAMPAAKLLLLKHQLLLLVLHPELPVSLLDLLANLVDARAESALFRRLGQELPLLG